MIILYLLKNFIISFFDYEVYLKLESLSFNITFIIINFSNKVNSNNKGKIYNHITSKAIVQTIILETTYNNESINKFEQ